MTQTAADLTSQISRLRSSYEDAKAKNEALGEKISQLQQALRYVLQAGIHANSVEGGIRKLDAGDTWAGTARKRLDNACEGGMGDGAESLHSAIDALRDEIIAKIWDLSLQVNYLVKLMSGAESAISSCQRALSNLLSGS